MTSSSAAAAWNNDSEIFSALRQGTLFTDMEFPSLTPCELASPECETADPAASVAITSSAFELLCGLMQRLRAEFLQAAAHENKRRAGLSQRSDQRLVRVPRMWSREIWVWIGAAFDTFFDDIRMAGGDYECWEHWNYDGIGTYELDYGNAWAHGQWVPRPERDAEDDMVASESNDAKDGTMKEMAKTVVVTCLYVAGKLHHCECCACYPFGHVKAFSRAVFGSEVHRACIARCERFFWHYTRWLDPFALRRVNVVDVVCAMEKQGALRRCFCAPSFVYKVWSCLRCSGRTGADDADIATMCASYQVWATAALLLARVQKGKKYDADVTVEVQLMIEEESSAAGAEDHWTLLRPTETAAVLDLYDLLRMYRNDLLVGIVEQVCEQCHPRAALRAWRAARKRAPKPIRSTNAQQAIKRWLRRLQHASTFSPLHPIPVTKGSATWWKIVGEIVDIRYALIGMRYLCKRSYAADDAGRQEKRAAVRGVSPDDEEGGVTREERRLRKMLTGVVKLSRDAFRSVLFSIATL